MPAVEELRIVAPDGVRLAATLYLPDGEGPWPALLEALPYRKDDLTASYRPEYVRFAEAGYAVCRVDVRGTGSSEGIATDEYPASERTDLLAVIDWLATRPWSTGAVGMFGTSYSGFNSLQLAIERPPALKAIVSIFASDDRYADDVHYYGGALKALDVLDYGTYMIAMNALPPVPSVYGDDWRDEWERRVRDTEPWMLTWLEHQTRDDYWRYGSAREAYGEIEAATMLVGGWADGYTNICLRSFPHLRCPKRVLLGPWSHAAVDTCLPGPNIDLVAEMLRWWDRWLKDEETGVADEPPIAVYQQRSTRPDPLRTEVRGGWRFEPTWPPSRLRSATLRAAEAEPGGLALPGAAEDRLPIRGDVGDTAWISCAASMPWGQSRDQRPDEAFSLTATWAPLETDLEVLGHAVLRARVRSDVPVAYLSAKVCDVFPDGASSLVVRGMANLAHLDPPAAPGEPVDVVLELEACGWTFEAGHRIRLDLAPSDWPNAWPPPRPGTISVERGSVSLSLPILDGPAPVEAAPSLPAPTRPQVDPRSQGDDGWWRWEIEEDPVAHERRAIAMSGGDEPAAGTTPAIASRYGGVVAVSTDDPGRARAEAEADLALAYPEAAVRSRVDVRLESDADTYRVAIDLVVSEDGRERWRRRWDREFPRDRQ
ncbi:MAG TPA: CocE/NonD family hydrolase [Actinomycetota bacterium]